MRPLRLKEVLRQVSLSALRIAAMLVIGLAISFQVFEERLIFHPERTLSSSPQSPYEDVQFPAADDTMLHGWFLPFKDSNRVFIISHGNAGNIGYRSEMAQYVRQEFRADVLLYDYRGYGKSSGEPSEQGLYSDLTGALVYVRSRGYSARSVYLMGQSLGTAVTVDLASREPVAGIILEAPFTNVRGVARHYLFSMPVDLLLRSRFDSLAKIPRIQAPIAIVHGKRDPVIPFSLGQQLFDAATGPKRFFAVDAEIHEGALMALGDARTRELRDFLLK